MIASIFVDGGLDTFRNPAPRAALGRSRLPAGLPIDMELAARANAMVMVAAGGALAVGLVPRVSAASLAATLVPATYVGHPFWTFSNPPERRTQRVHFFINLSLFGALALLAATEDE